MEIQCINFAALIFAYDITDRRSFQELGCWIQEVRNINNRVFKIIVRTNLENCEKEKITDGELINFANNNQASHCLVKTYNSSSIRNLFNEILEKALKIVLIKKKVSSSKETNSQIKKKKRMSQQKM